MIGRNGVARSGTASPKKQAWLRNGRKKGPKLLWQAKDMGAGYSTPSVVGKRLYLVSNEGTEKEFVQALEAADGKRAWSTPIGKVGPNEGPQYPGARSTPTVDGDLIYALGSDGDLVCLETSTGKIKWNKNLRGDFGGKPGKWAYAESPLVDGDMLVCTPGGSDATLVALNKKTGEIVWKSAVPGGDQAGYASIIKMDFNGANQYVQFVEKGVVGVNAKDGKSFGAMTRRPRTVRPTSRRRFAEDGYVYSGAGPKRRRADQSEAQRWRIRSGGNNLHAKITNGDRWGDQDR
jgi:outer membrane protein assembly factor BamB